MKKYYVEGELIDEMELEDIFEKLVTKYENYFQHKNKSSKEGFKGSSKEDMKKYPLTVYPRPISRPIFPNLG